MSTFRTVMHNAMGLALFAAVTVGVIALTATFTGERIAAQEERVRQAALYEILEATTDADIDLEQRVSLNAAALGHREPREAVIARRNDRAVALIVPVRIPDGYGGPIEVLLGIEPDGRVAGVRVVAHRETPGLGNDIERRRSDWIDAFRGRGLDDPPLPQWTVRADGGEFDGFTGATITPRAIARGIGRALVWFEDDGRALLEEAR
ncbi:MAG: electron transport complex subunit RsxG [Gammaproteobacteria bacterium]|nr:MAG: electron transport complex subunit RsxG [Gammaproteobacteria bacterium]